MERLTLSEAINHAREVAEKQDIMARTFRGFRDYGNPKSTITSGAEKCQKCSEEHEQLAEWLEELKVYKDAEEQGLLLRLPCKVGKTVYLIDHDRLVLREKPFICIVDEFTMSDIDCYAVLNANEPFYSMRRFKAVNIKDFGKTVFLTKEEAEQALKGGVE